MHGQTPEAAPKLMDARVRPGGCEAAMCALLWQLSDDSSSTRASGVRLCPGVTMFAVVMLFAAKAGDRNAFRYVSTTSIMCQQHRTVPPT
jgi:hypothetical protein